MSGFFSAHHRCRIRKKHKIGHYVIAGALAFQVFLALLIAQATASQPGSSKEPSVQAAAPVVSSEDAFPLPLESEEKFLCLVNWDNPAPSERPDDLICLASAFGEEVLLVNQEGSIQKDAASAAREMFLQAELEGIGPYKITTAYRSPQYQESLFQTRKEQDPAYGDDPYHHPVKVLPGNCSEHTTGLALDILSADYDQSDDGYADTPEGSWMAAHAHEFGFILRYPKGKESITGVIYEPWHFRFVGRNAAQEMYGLGLCLEEYLDVKSSG